MATFATRLREALDMNRMTAADLSKRTGISRGSISQYLDGSVMAKADKVMTISQVLNVSPAWLVGYEEPTNQALEEEVKIIFNSLPTHLQEQALSYLHFLARSNTPTNPEGSDESL